MLDHAICVEIQERTQTFWNLEVQKDYFSQTASGKEIGHRIADLVNDKTTGLLAVNYLTKYQRDQRGNKLPRSMGDIWLEHKGIFHPINVKTGVASTNGQPNMVSLKKLLDTLLQQQIDSYYLLMVKFDIQELITCAVYFLDMLDYLDYVTFDSGPGQIMLKANRFFAAMEQRVSPPKRTLQMKVERLLDLLEDGERRLAINRQRALESYRMRVAEYSAVGEHIVTPESQKSLGLE